jgi:hypothetical protein
MKLNDRDAPRRCAYNMSISALSRQTGSGSHWTGMFVAWILSRLIKIHGEGVPNSSLMTLSEHPARQVALEGHFEWYMV